jgi:hypothetical protein
MEEKKPMTITEGMEIESDFFEKSQNRVKELWGKHSLLSDLLLALAQETRDEALGKIEAPITSYEKKLILAGFMVGIVKERQNKLEESLPDFLKEALRKGLAPDEGDE